MECLIDSNNYEFYFYFPLSASIFSIDLDVALHISYTSIF